MPFEPPALKAGLVDQGKRGILGKLEDIGIGQLDLVEDRVWANNGLEVDHSATGVGGNRVNGRARGGER